MKLSAPPSPFSRVLILVSAAAWPLVNFARSNYSELALAEYAVIGLLIAAVSAAGFAISAAVSRITKGDPWAATCATAAGIVLFFTYSDVIAAIYAVLYSLFQVARGPIWIFALLSVAIIGAVYRFSTHSRVRPIIGLMFPIAALLSSVQLGLRAVEPGGEVVSASHTDPSHSVQEKRNVYFIILDGYARWDVLRHYTGIDLDPFFQRIGAEGFRVARNSTANYPTTFLSLSSTLQMNYVALPDSVPPTSLQPFFRIIQGRSEAVRQFRKIGYHYVHAGSGWVGAHCSGAEDVCLTSKRALAQTSELRNALMAMTPLRLVPWKVTAPSNDSGGLFELTEALKTSALPEPFFLFAHVASPHPPFSRGADCTPRKAIGGLADWAKPSFYGDMVLCTNRNIEELVELLGKQDPGAIVVFFSDHGSAFTQPFGSEFGTWTDAMIRERLPSFVASKFPEKCSPWFSDAITNVNLVRFVLACLQDRSPEYLPDRRFFANYKHARVMEVSAERLEANKPVARLPGHASANLSD